MSALDTYLRKHFLNAEQFAAACDCTTSDVADLIERGLVPAPSYVVTHSSTVRSHAFGEIEAVGSTPGHYFHPANVTWVGIARRCVADQGHEAAQDALKARFVSNVQVALAELNGTTWRLRDSFADDGTQIAAGLRTRSESMWKHFLHGTFGLCVASPVSEAAIARKEVLQEKLSHLYEKGIPPDFSRDDALATLELIDAYADAAMPFSPAEYHRSSRKRLVEDFRALVMAAQERQVADALHAAPRDHELLPSRRTH